jgi:hypothetical protein
MRGQFRHLHFKTFPMTLRTPQCEVFWPFNYSSELSGVPKDSKFPLLGVWASPSHLAQVGLDRKINLSNQILLMKFKSGTLWRHMNINPRSTSLQMNTSIITNLICANYNKVDQLNTKHLSAQSRLDPKGKLHCFRYAKKLKLLFLPHLIH